VSCSYIAKSWQEKALPDSLLLVNNGYRGIGFARLSARYGANNPVNLVLNMSRDADLGDSILA